MREMDPVETNIAPELVRLSQCVTSWKEIREAFDAMEDDGERERAYDYMRARYPDFHNPDIPTGREEAF